MFDFPVLHEVCGFFDCSVFVDGYEGVGVDHACDDAVEWDAVFECADEDVFDGYDACGFAALDDEDGVFVEFGHGGDDFLDCGGVVYDFYVFGHDVSY